MRNATDNAPPQRPIRSLLAFWRRFRVRGWEKKLRMAAHASQVILVVGATAGYFLTIRPINQKEQLEEDMVTLRKAADVSRAEAIRLGKERGALQDEAERAKRATVHANAEAKRAAQASVDLQAKLNSQRDALVKGQEQFKEHIAAERAVLEAQLRAEKLRAEGAEKRVLTAAEEQQRMRTFNTLRAHIVATCLAPTADMFIDLEAQLTTCISQTTLSLEERLGLTSADRQAIQAWAERESRLVEQRARSDQRRDSALGRLVMTETLSATVPCDGFSDNSGEIIEFPLGTGKRCIGRDTMGGVVGSFVARYGAVQSSVEAAIAGAAERRDASKFAAPMAPTSISVE